MIECDVNIYKCVVIVLMFVGGEELLIFNDE